MNDFKRRHFESMMVGEVMGDLGFFAGGGGFSLCGLTADPIPGGFAFQLTDWAPRIAVRLTGFEVVRLDDATLCFGS